MALNWSAADIPSQRSRIAVVTGPSGLGYETALALAASGAYVILAGRNPSKGTTAIEKIVGRVPGATIAFEEIDLSSLSSVERFATRLSARVDHVDMLINNAGIMMPPSRRLTEDGFELQFATNHLGHFALTACLLPLLRKATAARVVSVTSQAHRSGKISFDDLHAKRSYNPFLVYAQSKLAQLLFALELQRRSDRHRWGLLSNAAHPGWAKTGLFENGPGAGSVSDWINRHIAEPLFAQSAAAGALPTLFAATAADARGGALYGPSGFYEMRGPPKQSRLMLYAQDPQIASRLWNVSEQLVRKRFD